MVGGDGLLVVDRDVNVIINIVTESQWLDVKYRVTITLDTLNIVVIPYRLCTCVLMIMLTIITNTNIIIVIVVKLCNINSLTTKNTIMNIYTTYYW